MLILKCGGAAITDKATANTPRPEFINQLAGLIARYPQPLILIHGAGSFGHILAHDFELHKGFHDERQRSALVRLQVQLHELNRIMIDALNNAGVPAVPVHPASMCVMENRRISALFTEPIQRTLQMEMVPVLYGDCVWDRAQVFGIISGDQLAVFLANELGADKLAFGTNVDGVLDENGQVLDQLNAQAQIVRQPQAGQIADVTGGMLGKLREIAALKNLQTRTWIFNLHNLDHLERILAGQGSAGTLIMIDEE